MIHSYGANRYFVSVHVEVDAEEDVMRSHDLIDNIEEDFRRELGIHMVIHMDPIQYKDAHVNEIRARVSSIIGEMSSQYSSPISMHDFRIVSGVTHSNLIFDVAVTDDFPVKDEALCAELQGEVKKIDPSYNAVSYTHLYTELLDTLISLAIKRSRQEEDILFSFDTNLLALSTHSGTKGAKSGKKV